MSNSENRADSEQDLTIRESILALLRANPDKAWSITELLTSLGLPKANYNARVQLDALYFQGHIIRTDAFDWKAAPPKDKK